MVWVADLVRHGLLARGQLRSESACCATETSSARVITMSNPSIRLGFLTKSDETKKTAGL